MTTHRPVPLPPLELATRVGPGLSPDPYEAYEQEGAGVRRRIEAMLPEHWEWRGKKVLDFGCGSARVLRQFLAEAETSEFWGCDIDGPSVAWIQANLDPPLHAMRNELVPPLSFADETFDLIWATSVFTHIDAWSEWLLELHRVLAPDGLLVATFLGEGMWDALLGEPYVADEVGMAVRGHWVDGGPGAWVFHSEWWLRAHWGRLFDVIAVDGPPRNADGSPQVTHSYIALRKLPETRSVEELEAVDPAEGRELVALRTYVRVLRAEIDGLVAAQATDPPGPVTLREAVTRSRLGPLGRRVKRAAERVRVDRAARRRAGAADRSGAS